MQLSLISLALTRIYGGTASFTPASLFASGEQGVWYDPSDMSTMFQDSAGTTPVTAAGQPVGLILVDLAVRLKAEAKYGDSLEIRVAVSEFTRVGFELAYQIVRPADGGEVARATTGFAFFDYARGALCPAPTGFREKAGAGLP